MSDGEAKLILALIMLGILAAYGFTIWLVTLPDRRRARASKEQGE